MATENNNNTPKENQGPQSEGRRNALKALATIPVLGALGYGVYKKQTYDKKSKSLGSAFKFDKEHYMIPAQPDGKKIRIGMIGFGIRGISQYEDADYTLVIPEDLLGNTKWNSNSYEVGRSNPELRYEFNVWELAGKPREDKTTYDFNPISDVYSIDEVTLSGGKTSYVFQSPPRLRRAGGDPQGLQYQEQCMGCQ